ncbi:hypothetical protein A0256_12120 [Mucilaginibacter sp. PAMC 26640]|nr:hypothetical protein A0256_12120 [Mucilaginibacter sp. PAMC 26640]
MILSWVLTLFFSLNSFARNAVVHITIKNLRGSALLYDPQFRYDLSKRTQLLKLDADQSVTYTMFLDHPDYLILLFSEKLSKYSLFLCPGDELFLSADMSAKNDNIKVTGKGSNNNQPEIFALINMDVKSFDNDTDPNRVITAINRRFLVNKSILLDYIRVYKPSPEFIKAANYNLQYFAPMAFYESSHNNVFGKPYAQKVKWKNIQDSLFSNARINNGSALTAYNYTRLVDDFLLRGELSDLMDEYRTNPKLFFKKWFHTDQIHGKELFNYAQVGMLNKFIIDKYFTGTTAEYSFGQAIKYLFNKADYSSAAFLFDHFKKKFPANVYIERFSPQMTEVYSKQKQVFNHKTVFVSDNGAKLNTLNEVIALNKSKAVFIDMWGTWCGPCREEIQKNASSLRAHFQGKDVVFLYIANMDSGREREWKKQIAFFNIEGKHILANANLTKDIMRKVVATGYPTYIIIKKDGSYKQTITKYPVNLNILIKEIETASNNK